MDSKIAAYLRSGLIDGQRLEPVEQFESGVTARQSDGKLVFLTNERLALVSSRARGIG